MAKELHGTAKVLNEIFTVKGGIENYNAELTGNGVLAGICIGIFTIQIIEGIADIAAYAKVKKRKPSSL